jgi:hypothetical protein
MNVGIWWEFLDEKVDSKKLARYSAFSSSFTKMFESLVLRAGMGAFFDFRKEPT